MITAEFVSGNPAMASFSRKINIQSAYNLSHQFSFCATGKNSQIGKLTTMPMGMIYASVSVHMAKEEESKKQLVRPEQLPIYTVPPLQSKYVEEQPGYLQTGFASIRTTTGYYIGWCKSTYVFVKNGVMDTVQFGKGSRFKKIAYPLGLATLGAAVCYPAQSVIIAKVTGKKAYATSQQIYEAVKSLWTKSTKKESLPEPKGKTKKTGKKAYATSQQIYEAVKSLWTKSTKKESLPEPKGKTKLGNSDETEIPAETTHILKPSVPLPTDFSSATMIKSEPTSGATLFMPDPKLMDHGQSYPEDEDMYSTRS
ncbi:Apolipoprotein O-like [Fukomys damarensis]|uniref:MICOS complex subunit n=1 Tax=Fukomys damarensis TaxID=885580 RepID=A0A091CQ37_FUKDA|nr:Apolipoprotein O-like [Fukomys damarensis]